MSQVNPLAPFFLTNASGVPILDELLGFLKGQVTGYINGLASLRQGRLLRPFGARAVDLVAQDYAGSVTICPRWELPELGVFLANFH